MEFLLRYLWDILQGFIVTVEVTLFGAFAGLALGTLLALGDLYGGRVVSILIGAYTEFFRGSPIIVQLFFFYFSIPSLLETTFDAFAVGLVVFALNSAAYQKGYIKGAIAVISEDQMMAALSLGLSKIKAIFYVILPQALRLVIPAWSNEFCSLTKSTAALLVIGVKDLTSVGLRISSWHFRYVETFLVVAIIYLAWVTVVTKIADEVYERVKIPGIEISA
ncbi:MAG: amino acid ABC transporter permease [Candidatus Bathyarchaeota archaeon]|nr:amino acid ABC transporter permease [Candidatus Bathyarchaeota archaeon]MDW8040062.1 amino acid ABC transporter permease [Nitrososphaerota archaeon]